MMRMRMGVGRLGRLGRRKRLMWRRLNMRIEHQGKGVGGCGEGDADYDQ